MTTDSTQRPAAAPPRLLHHPAWPWLLALASPLLLLLCYPPFHEGWLVWVGLAPLAAAVWWPRAEPIVLPAKRWRRWLAKGRPFWLGYFAGVIFFTGAFHWLGALGVLFHSPFLYALGFYLALYFGVYFGFWTWFLHFLVPAGPARNFSSSLRNLGFAALAASAWVFVEWVRSWMFTGYDWNTLAVAMHRDLSMIQIAELTGGAGLSWLAAFANVMAVIIVRRILAELGPAFLKRVRWEFSATMALIAAVFSYGVRTLLAPPTASEPLRVASIQPNIPQEERFRERDNEQKILERLTRLHKIAASTEPELILWPEAVIPGGLRGDAETTEFGRKAAQVGDIALLMGSLDFEQNPRDPDDSLVYNSALLLTEKGRKLQSFRKTHLVIFGEYLPFRGLMPSLITNLVPGDLAQGSEFNVLTLEKPAMKLGALVCFEDSLAGVVRQLVLKGAQVLVNVTNDGWFLHTAGAEQHLANAVLRTVETRRPLVRCTNTGVTCSVDPFGRIEPWRVIDADGRIDRWLTPFMEAAAIPGAIPGQIRVPKSTALTFYTRHGEWLAHLCTAVTALALVTLAIRRRQQVLPSPPPHQRAE